MVRVPTEVVEFAGFRAKASRLLTDEERVALIEVLSTNPKHGREFDGTGGVRHLLWPPREGNQKAKAEVGYYFGDGSTPVLLVTICRFGEKNLLAKVIRGLAVQS